MSDQRTLQPPPLPATLAEKLVDLRRRLWSTKTLEALFAALAGLLLSYLFVFALDRFVDTHPVVRLVALAAGLVGGVLFLPVQVARWVGGHASLLSIARRVAREDLKTGDELLGVFELTQDPAEFRRSPELALAAIETGERRLRDRDLSHTLPKSRHRLWGGWAFLFAMAAIVAFALVPAAASNAFARWAKPFGGVERFTFTRLEPHPEELVVARFETAAFALTLAGDTDHTPDTATLSVSGGAELSAANEGGVFTFELPALTDPTRVRIFAGDYRGSMTVSPVDRPEIADVRATVELPAYLELPDEIEKDVRGGSVGVVEGAAVSVTAELTRELTSAEWSVADARVDGAELSTASFVVEEPTDSVLEWRDVHGLEGSAPFPLALRSRPDDAPTVIVDGLETDMILLHDQAIAFEVLTSDDFGVRRVGLTWEGTGELFGDNRLASGEKMLDDGAPDAASLTSFATLHPKQLGIDPQTIELRGFAVDSLPGRERAFSAPVRVHVMTEDDHMIWITRALARWHDQAVEVRDTETALLSTNEELFSLSPEELARPEMRRRIQNQAANERSNARRLRQLVNVGSDYLDEAARNPQFNSNTLNEWAEMMAVLEDIAANRMPSVAELLNQASESVGEVSPIPMTAGPVRDTGKEPGAGAPVNPIPNDPLAVDVESSFNEASDKPPGEGSETPPPPSSLTLVETTVMGGGAPQEEQDPPPPSSNDYVPPSKEELAKAIEEQRALLEEFKKVAGEIADILADLEGSTFVKRLKALSRTETGVADDLDERLTSAFGADDVPDELETLTSKVERVQEDAGQRASLVREDLSAYIERLEARGADVGSFQTVHTEMGDVGVAREMSTIGDLAEIARSGEAIAAAENLADHLDRWAELLVGPG